MNLSAEHRPSKVGRNKLFLLEKRLQCQFHKHKERLKREFALARAHLEQRWFQRGVADNETLELRDMKQLLSIAEEESKDPVFDIKRLVLSVEPWDLSQTEEQQFNAWRGFIDQVNLVMQKRSELFNKVEVVTVRGVMCVKAVNLILNKLSHQIKELHLAESFPPTPLMLASLPVLSHLRVLSMGLYEDGVKDPAKEPLDNTMRTLAIMDLKHLVQLEVFGSQGLTPHDLTLLLSNPYLRKLRIHDFR